MSSIPGEFPPPPPRACFGRDELIEKIIGLAENLTPVALVGTGGIGKTSIALTVLHDNRITERFGDNRRFIRCDQFTASCAHLLSRLSEVIGAGIENPKNLTLLRPFLSSNEMLIVLDNAESILDPQGMDAQEIYAVIGELSQFKTVSLCVTSRIATVPRHWKRLVIPTLSIEEACDIFYDIYGDNGRSDIINDLLRRLDFHALSIALLANVAFHNMWDYDRLAKEWDTHRTQVLRTDYNESLAATIELSLASPTFRELGPNAHDLLSVVAFFPQGINESNLDWLFPTVSDRTKVFDKFCILSLTYRSNGFVTMLAPLRDYLSPKDPKSSSLLCMTKHHYFTRMAVNINPNKPNFGETRWITSEDVNVEHLLDVFTTIDADSDSIWGTCANFMEHLSWHKQRLVILGPKIEGLPDGHRSKPKCLLRLARLFQSVGNHVERKRLLTHTLRLYRERGDDRGVARTLGDLFGANWEMGLREEGIRLVEEAVEIYKRLINTVAEDECFTALISLLGSGGRPNATEEVASRGIDLFAQKGEQYRVCELHRGLGQLYHSKGETEKAINHFEVARGIASSFDWHDQLFFVHYDLAKLSLDESRFDDAQAHVERARSHASNHTYSLGRAMEVQAELWYRQDRLEEAMSEAVRAADVYEKLGAAKDLKKCGRLIEQIGLRVVQQVLSTALARALAEVTVIAVLPWEILQ